jgi:hypothetical protein
MAAVAITPNQDVITGEIFIAPGPPARVFQAITDPKQMPRWWGASNLYRIQDFNADVRVGGQWSSYGVGVDGTTFRVNASISKSIPLVCLSKPGSAVGPAPSKPLFAGSSSRKPFTVCILQARSVPVPVLC